MQWMYAFPSTLPLGLDAFGNPVPIMIMCCFVVVGREDVVFLVGGVDFRGTANIRSSHLDVLAPPALPPAVP